MPSISPGGHNAARSGMVKEVASSRDILNSFEVVAKRIAVVP